MNATQYPGHQQFKNKLPSIFQIQDMIESAWDAGIHVQGRAETGGIRGTRKYIGTPEVSPISHPQQLLSRTVRLKKVSHGLWRMEMTHKWLTAFIGSCYVQACGNTVSSTRGSPLPAVVSWKVVSSFSNPPLFRLSRCDAQGFKDKDPSKAESLLLDHVEKYFMSGVVDPEERIRATNLPPIYFQHPGKCSTGILCRECHQVCYATQTKKKKKLTLLF